MNHWTHPAMLSLLLSSAAMGQAATNPPATPKAAPAPELTFQSDPCKSEVAKFEEAIGFIRQHQGVEAAGALKEKLLPAKLEAELLSTQGYCGLAKYIRDKKLNR